MPPQGSGLGQRQRIAIARALLRDVPILILILDEPLAGLDSTTARALLARLHGAECEAEAQSLRISLGKTRRGFGAALDEGAVVADPASGLVLRRPGMDARLPDLRLSHRPPDHIETARQIAGAAVSPVNGAIVGL